MKLTDLKFVIYITVIFQIFQLCKSSEVVESEEKVFADLSWNELKFTQNWGYTACKEFKTRSGQKCQFEDKPSIWSIHGIWPTKLGTEGPNFCSKVQFNIDSLSLIRDKLNLYWYEISNEKGPNDFWKHEWTKHGSCASEISYFDTEFKYFEKGLEFRSKYDLYSMLKNEGILPNPDNGYFVKDVENAIVQNYGGLPIIQCYHSKENGNTIQYLLSVEICLDKNLKVVDCKSKKLVKGGSSGQCSSDVKIIYTDISTEDKKNEL